MTENGTNSRLTLEEVTEIGEELTGSPSMKRRNGDTWAKLVRSLCLEIVVLHGEGKTLREMLDSEVDEPSPGALNLEVGLSLHLPHKKHREALAFLAEAKAKGVDIDLVQQLSLKGS